MSARLEFLTDPAEFLAVAGPHLAADPVLTTVVATVAARLAENGPCGRDTAAPYCWWAVARNGSGRVVGAAMRNAPFSPYPAYVLPMPEWAAVELARSVHGRGEELIGVNGALPAARTVAEETARLAGGVAEVDEHTRLFELGELASPPPPPGRLRPAEPTDAELCLAWFLDFGRAAAEQAGRDGAKPSPTETFTLDDMRQRVEAGLIWLWQDQTGRPVHLTAANPPAHGVTRIGPVYTPREHRGHGYASRAVAEVSASYLAQGVRCCLFTDQANPVSNRIYEAIGYRPVVDMANLLVR